ncbi:MAG: M23 family metallopeptidase [Turicibacter sp.]|nr:peptidoglycan DD-metalloendopeptidase family protein [Turicibacter sp.]MEE1237908.1 M23 family metallopeptidase [Turicibacter sp.]
MPDRKKMRPPYRHYPSNKSSAYYKRNKQEDDSILFLRRFMSQSIICLCLLMSVLVFQKLPNIPVYENVKDVIMGSFPFSKYEKMYQELFLNMFPFDYALPTKDEEAVLTSQTENTTVDEAGNPVTQNEESDITFDIFDAINEMYNNVVLSDYENGVVIQTTKDEEILSVVSGIVLNIGVDDKISNYITVQLEDESILTIGFLENRTVSQYQHIKVGDVLGIGAILGEDGTEFGDGAYYYLSLKDKNGEYKDIVSYLDEYMQ